MSKTSLLSRFFYELSYRFNRAPWDTGISPPELRALIEGPNALAPGRMLDLGCGTALNLVYAGQHGWQGDGIDFAAPAVARATARIRANKLTATLNVYQGDVTRLQDLPLRPPYNLIFDLGCFHGLNPEQRTDYATGIAALSQSGTLFLLYAFLPRTVMGRKMGFEPSIVVETFTPNFQVLSSVKGQNAAYWYTLQRQ